MLSTLMVVLAVTGASDWQCADAEWRQQFWINTSILKEDLLNFPLTLDLGNIQPEARASAKKSIRAFTTEGTELLSTSWGDGSVRLEVAVLIPVARAGQDALCINLYYGGPPGSPLPGAKPWSPEYRCVMHFAGNAANEALPGGEAALQGNVAIDSFATFKGGEAYLTPQATWMQGIEFGFTLFARIRTTGGETLQNIMSGRRKEGAEEWLNFGIKRPGEIHVNATSDGKRVGENNAPGFSDGEWHSVALALDAVGQTRTLCVDGIVLQRDKLLPGPLRFDEYRIGRGLLHFEPWQFQGEMAEFRVVAGVRSDAWLMAETANPLGTGSRFLVAGEALKQGMEPRLLSSLKLLSPADEFAWKTRANVTLEWFPAPGVSSYGVLLFPSKDAAEPAARLQVGSKTNMVLTRDSLPCLDFWWSVEATDGRESFTTSERRHVSCYDWSSSNMNTSVSYAVKPEFSVPERMSLELSGYLRERIDRLIRRYYCETPESSPAILQVMRDRDKTPVRDPLMPWAGEFAGKYLTGAQLAWRLTGDSTLKTVIDGFAHDLVACQGPDGYLGPFNKDTRLTGSNWDVWGHYHCILGLLLYYEDTGWEPALEACKKAGDLLFETFGPGGPSLTCDGSGGQMNMAICHGMMLLYMKTGVQRYLDLAKYVVHDAWNEANAGQYMKSALEGKKIIEFPQHRWEAIHDWQALADLYWLTGEEDYRKTFEHIYQDGVQGDRHNTGGVTAGEGFTGSPYAQGAIETCCTVAWIAYTFDMLRLTGDSRAADEMEWSTYNSALGAIPYSGRVCAYNVPMDGTRCFGVELPWQSPKAGPDLNCCAVNAGRPLGMIAQWALMQDRDGNPVVNYYGAGQMKTALPSGGKLQLTQVTSYPVEPEVKITVKLDKSASFALKLRIPFWSKVTYVKLNDRVLENPVEAGKYLSIERMWSDGDVIEITMDFALRTWKGEQECAGKFSAYRGPLLLAFDARFSDTDPGQIAPMQTEGLSFDRQDYNGAIAPWMFGSLKDTTGARIPVCDFSSAGQTGNHYRSWLPLNEKADAADGK